MTRTLRFDLTLDTSHFTGQQLQQRTLLSLAWNGYARWLKQYVVSLPQLIQEHQLGTVIVGAKIDYLEPFTFFEADTLQIEVAVRPWARQILALNACFYGAERPVAQVTLLLYPVAIEETHTLAAVPTRIPNYLLPLFQGDIMDDLDLMPTIEAEALAQQIEREGQLLATDSGNFMVHNHLIEVAEQWAFIETPAIVQAARGPLVLNRHEELPQLRRALSHPLQRYDMELYRPFFVYDLGCVQTTAYQWQEKLAFIHRLYSEHSRHEVHGLIVEQF